MNNVVTGAIDYTDCVLTSACTD